MSWKKYQIEHKIISTDGGRTWHPVEPEETRMGSVMGVYQSYEACQNAMYRWVPLDDEICSYLPDENTAVLYTFETENGQYILKGIDRDKSNYCSDYLIPRIGDSVLKLVGFDVFSEFDDGTTVPPVWEDDKAYADGWSYGISNLKWINYEAGTIPNTLEVGDSATFSSLERLNVGSGVTVEDEAFFFRMTYPFLSAVTWESENLTMDFLRDSNPSELYITTNRVTEIPWRAYAGCSWITDVVTGVQTGNEPFGRVIIPSGVTLIDSYAFSGCTSLTSVTIPSGVTDIGSNVLQGCPSLTSITVLAETPPTLGSSAFLGASDSLGIYVPAASVNDYKEAPIWYSFANKIYPIA